QENASQLLPFERPLPRGHPARHNRQGRGSRYQQVEIRRRRQRRVLPPRRKIVERHRRDAQSNREVNQHDVLRVLGQHHGSDVKGIHGHRTTTFPVIFGWIEQKYGNVPGASKVNENFSSVSSTLDLNTLSVLTTVWGM